MEEIDKILAANRMWADACKVVEDQERNLAKAKGMRIAVARKVHGLIPVDIMADRAGVSRHTIWKWTKEEQ